MGKITKIFPILCIFWAGVLDICLGVEIDEKNLDFNLTSIEIIRNYGYPAEVHKVQTDDGYILELHRIPHGKYSDSKRGVLPILLGHGLLASSIEFFLLESDSLAFVLADAGYDVWMLNFRGSTYSRNHISLQSNSTKFWDFSWHEMGVYDIPSSIDYICKYTQKEQLLYVGYSMGTTVFFAMASTRPEYQEKLHGAVLLGPTAYVKHTKTPLRVLAPFSKTLKGLHEFIRKGGVFEQTPELQNFMKVLCKPQFFCKNILFLMAGRNSREFQNNVLPKAVMHLPASTSVKTIAHFGQLIMSGKFQQYDYGTAGNLKRYNQKKPPMYNLEAITTPLSIFIAPKDYFATKIDLYRLLERLKSVKTIQIVPSPRFTHIDFVVSKNIRKLLYSELLKEVEQLMSNKTVAKTVKQQPKAPQNKTVPNNQDEVVYNEPQYNAVDRNAVNQNKIVYNEVEQNKVYSEADYNLIDQNKAVYNEANQDKFVYNEAKQDKVVYNEANQDTVVYNDDQYNQAIDQNKVVNNADYNSYNPADYNSYNPTGYNSYNPTGYNSYNPTGYNSYNPTGYNSYNPTGYNSYNPTGYNSYNPTAYNSANKNKVVYTVVNENDGIYNEIDQNEDFYGEVDYIPVKYKKVNYIPKNYQKFDYGRVQYSDF